MELRAFLSALMDDSAWGTAASSLPERGTFLVIVARSHAALLEHLQKRFAGDPLTEVLVDRRTPRPSPAPSYGPERRRGGRHSSEVEYALMFHGVAIVRRDAPATDGSTTAPTSDPQLPEETTTMEQSQSLDDRTRVDRWLEESQYLIGRLIPAFLEDRDRLKGKLEAAEQESDRLRHEIGELRREVANLHAELQFFRGEHAAAAEAASSVINQLADVLKPLNDMYHRLQIHPASAGHGSMAESSSQM
ncbi:MAG TPA: hypothetical protein VNN07_11685 [Candidatus Tectomicrobia bacterium]|nr:hypothetical protein [Candidatus Tectomicrobia bacterium]